IVVATSDAAVQFTCPRERLENLMMQISASEPISIEEITSVLNDGGYVNVELVDGEGQFSVRGGIVDIFPPGDSSPVRIELFGDEIDSMSRFDALTQRRTVDAEGVFIIPAREVLPDERSRKKIAGAEKALIERAPDEKIRATLSAELESAVAGGEMMYRDRYISLIYPEKETLFDYFDGGSVVLTCDLNACRDTVNGSEWHGANASSTLVEEGLLSPEFANFGIGEEGFVSFVSSHCGVVSDRFITSAPSVSFAGLYGLTARQTARYADRPDLLAEDIPSYVKNGFAVAVLCENDAMRKSVGSMLESAGLPYHVDAKKAEPGIVNLLISPLDGFELTAGKRVVLSTVQQSGISGVKKRRSSKSSSHRATGERIMSYADMSVGDYVVHVKHGIGVYQGLETITVEGVTSDYVKIKYDGSDTLFLPCDQLDSISKYIGPNSDDGALKLSKIGGTEWTNSKKKVKAAARKMAAELIALYAERERTPGFAFGKDDALMHDFEESFPYDETEGQLQAINEVKRDMELARPMDRLLCGDVGFGKTEVALRAAFKAVSAGKQVAILVPTTILALQHYQTLQSRLRGFPVSAEMLSRFRTPKEIGEALRRIKRGETDIVVGTHRILSQDVGFRDLGLVIIDEEQRFGVAAKEKLRQMTVNVDTLTLTATPIPRTLSMSMSGIRDMSILEEAPGDRLPVQTYVLEYDGTILAEALRKELRRGGQVFWLRNRIDCLEETAQRIRKAVPEARVAVASGRTDKDELSDVWNMMLRGETDILVCTTIIESGVDVPNANTLVVEDSDLFGLSQLHQIRGRVGRSSRRAFAYFTYRKHKALSDISVRRLEAIREYTEFGSGFKIALRDLEIRGAGTLLGAEQSGHISNVGYDMYMKLLNEAVLEIKGEKPPKKTECSVDLGISAFIPGDYISSQRQRIEIYKKISLVSSVDDTVDIVDELIDRYGEPPMPVVSLMDIALLRSICERSGIVSVSKRSGNVVIVPEVMDLKKWIEMTAMNNGKLLISMDVKPYVTLRIGKGGDVLDETLELIKQYGALCSADEGGNSENKNEKD
ncbi:MAG: transcription-repair coupling factor, partial [Clostridia bacterium]|nr:transcription-repair coupling factor [Clostridia bacterium]